MKHSFFSRRVLLRGALSLALAGIVAGCGGGGGSLDDSGSTRANLVFSNASTSATTLAFVLAGSRPEVTSTTSGIHAGYVPETKQFHVLVLDIRNGLRRTLRLQMATDDPRNPQIGDSFPLGNIVYVQSGGTWRAVSGSATVTGANGNSFTISMNSVRFQLIDNSSDAFTLSGTVTLSRDAITNESDEVFQNHQNGFSG